MNAAKRRPGDVIAFPPIETNKLTVAEIVSKVFDRLAREGHVVEMGEEQLRVLGQVVLTCGRSRIDHDCAEHPSLPCAACVAAETGYWECKPHTKAEAPNEILDNAMWHLVQQINEPSLGLSPNRQELDYLINKICGDILVLYCDGHRKPTV